MPKTDPPRDRRLYGRAQGKPLSARKQRLVDDLLPRLSPPAEGPVEPAALFSGAAAFVLEIGFGGAEHLIAQASRAPETGFIGVEPFIDGVAKALAGVEDHDLGNVRLLRGDARDLAERIPAASLDRIYILFPDPWPKKRHWKRRIISQHFVSHLARVLKPGGRLRFATDVSSYQDWALQRFIAEPRLEWLAERARDWRDPPADHVTTRYEEKKLGDAPPVFFDFRRV